MLIQEQFLNVPRSILYTNKLFKHTIKNNYSVIEIMIEAFLLNKIADSETGIGGILFVLRGRTSDHFIASSMWVMFLV